VGNEWMVRIVMCVRGAARCQRKREREKEGGDSSPAFLTIHDRCRGHHVRRQRTSSEPTLMSRCTTPWLWRCSTARTSCARRDMATGSLNLSQPRSTSAS